MWHTESWATTRMTIGEPWTVLVTEFTKVLFNTAHDMVGAELYLQPWASPKAGRERVTWVLVHGTIRTRWEAIGQKTTGLGICDLGASCNRFTVARKRYEIVRISCRPCERHRTGIPPMSVQVQKRWISYSTCMCRHTRVPPLLGRVQKHERFINSMRFRSSPQKYKSTKVRTVHVYVHMFHHNAQKMWGYRTIPMNVPYK